MGLYRKQCNQQIARFLKALHPFRAAWPCAAHATEHTGLPFPWPPSYPRHSCFPWCDSCPSLSLLPPSSVLVQSAPRIGLLYFQEACGRASSWTLTSPDGGLALPVQILCQFLSWGNLGKHADLGRENWTIHLPVPRLKQSQRNASMYSSITYKHVHHRDIKSVRQTFVYCQRNSHYIMKDRKQAQNCLSSLIKCPVYI